MGSDIEEMTKILAALCRLMDGMAYASAEHATLRRVLKTYLGRIVQFLPPEYVEPR